MIITGKWLFTCVVLLKVINNQANSPVKSCIENILDTIQPLWMSQILTNFETGLKYPVVITNNVTTFEKSPLANVRYDVVIINTSLLSIEDFLTWNSKKEYFNPAATYILLTPNISSKPFKILAKHYIKSAYILDSNSSIYTYHPYEYENVDDPDISPVKIGECHSNYIKIPDNYNLLWRNTTVKVAYRIIEPYTTKNSDGLEDIFLILVQQTLKTKLTKKQIHFNYEHNTGNAMKDESISKQGIDMLKKGEADLLIGYNSPTKITYKHFDVSDMYYYDVFTWVYPNVQMMSHWKRMFHIFSGELWFFLLFAIIIWISLVYYVEKEICLCQLFFVVYQVLFENAVSKSLFTNRRALKLLFSAWIMAFMIISTTFKNSLLVILGTEKKLPEFLTIQDLLNLKFNIISHEDLSTVYIDNTPIRDIYHIGNCSSVMVCVNRTAFEKNSITMSPRSVLWYNWIPKYYITDYGEVLVKVSSTTVQQIYVNMILRKGYPLYGQINDILVKLRDTGWFNYLYLQMRIRIKMATNRLVFEAKKIGMRKFGFVFILWGLGLIMAAIVFIFEIALYGTLRNFRNWCRCNCIECTL